MPFPLAALPFPPLTFTSFTLQLLPPLLSAETLITVAIPNHHRAFATYKPNRRRHNYRRSGGHENRRTGTPNRNIDGEATCTRRRCRADANRNQTKKN